MPSNNSITTEDICDLLAQPFSPLEWIIPDILPEGLTIFAGKSKSGKSRFALDLSTGVTTGTHVLGKFAVKEGEVLYLAFEDSERRIKSRVSMLLAEKEKSPNPGMFHYKKDWRQIDQGGIEDIKDWLEKHPNTRLIIVDTWKYIQPPSKHKANYEEAYKATEGLHRLAETYHVAILLIHHTRKTEAQYIIDEVLGSTGFVAGADTILVLRTLPERGKALLHVKGRDVEDGEYNLKQGAASWVLDGKAPKRYVSKQREEVLNLLQQHPSGMKSKDIASMLRKSRDATTHLLGRMHENNEVSCDMTTYIYTLPNASTTGEATKAGMA